MSAGDTEKTPALGVRLRVGNLSEVTTREGLSELFKSYGEVLRADVKKGDDGRCEGTGFVVLPTVELAKQAQSEVNGKTLGEKKLLVEVVGGAPLPLSPWCGPTSAADNIADPISDGPGRGRSTGRPGNSPLGPDVQGFGIRRAHPPPFDPIEQADEAFAFYEENGYVVVNSLNECEVAELNATADEWHRDRGAEIDVRGQGQLVFPLVNYPEFDVTVFHPSTLPLIGRILGGMDKARHIEFNYRAWQPGTSDYGMPFHPDDCSGGLLTLEQRQTRRPYGPPDMVMHFTYLTDVDETTPAFAVVPRSRRTDNIQCLREALGDEYAEVPIMGKAGTCCICDRSLIHTRLDPVEKDPAKQRPRRVIHHVFARAGELRNSDGSLRTGNGQPLAVNPGLFSRGLIPQRLTHSENPDVRRLFSLRPSHQKDWMAAGFDPKFVGDPKCARGPTR